MSSVKRVFPLKLDKTSEKKKYPPAIRLDVNLEDPTSEFCSVFSVYNLLAEDKKKLRQKLAKHEKSLNIDTIEDDEDVKKLASYYEAKYGGGNNGRRKKKPSFYNYSDLAAGYDESDSFIDNADFYDEQLPEEMEPLHGGYYVNRGELELRKVEWYDDNTVARSGCSSSYSLDSDDESDGSSPKRKKHKFNVSDDSDDDDEEDQPKEEGENENASKAESTADMILKGLSTDSDAVKDSEKKVAENGVFVSMSGLENGPKKKGRKKKNPDEKILKPRKKSITVKSLLEEKRTGKVSFSEQGALNDEIGSNNEKRDSSGSILCSSVNDVIESVVNAARSKTELIVNDDAVAFDAGMRLSPADYDENHETRQEESDEMGMPVHSPASKDAAKLPDYLPSSILKLIEDIKMAAKIHDRLLGNRAFFTPKINAKLLQLEIEIRPYTSSCRHAIYRNLISCVPCSKETLMKRAKNLIVEEEERSISKYSSRLKTYIDSVMPALIKQHVMECQEVAETREEEPNDCKDEEVSSKIPEKRFIWNDESREYLKNIAICRLRCFFLLKLRKESPEDYVTKFLNTEVRPLWPQGWMKTSILVRESQLTHLISKVKKEVLSTRNAVCSGRSSVTSPINASSVNCPLTSVANSFISQNVPTSVVSPQTKSSLKNDLNLLATRASPVSSISHMYTSGVCKFTAANNLSSGSKTTKIYPSTLASLLIPEVAVPTPSVNFKKCNVSSPVKLENSLKETSTFTNPKNSLINTDHKPDIRVSSVSPKLKQSFPVSTINDLPVPVTANSACISEQNVRSSMALNFSKTVNQNFHSVVKSEQNDDITLSNLLEDVITAVNSRDNARSTEQIEENVLDLKVGSQISFENHRSSVNITSGITSAAQKVHTYSTHSDCPRSGWNHAGSFVNSYRESGMQDTKYSKPSISSSLNQNPQVTSYKHEARMTSFLGSAHRSYPDGSQSASSTSKQSTSKNISKPKSAVPVSQKYPWTGTFVTNVSPSFSGGSGDNYFSSGKPYGGALRVDEHYWPNASRSNENQSDLERLLRAPVTSSTKPESARLSPYSSKKLIEETTTATDILSQIINDSLQETPSAQQSHFSRNYSNYKDTSVFQSNNVRDESYMRNFESEGKHKNQSFKRQSMSQLENDVKKVAFDVQRNSSSVSPTDVYRSTVSVDTRYAVASSVNKSYVGNTHVLHSSPVTYSTHVTSSTMPRMSISGFKNEFFKHMSKTEEDPFVNVLNQQIPKSKHNSDFGK